MKIFMNRRPIDGPYGGGNRLFHALYSHLPSLGWEIVGSLDREPDVVLMLDPRPDQYCNCGAYEIAIYRETHPDTRVLHRVNECDQRKSTVGVDAMLRVANECADATVFVSEWMREYHLQRGWKDRNLSVIVNGVDRDVFRTNEKINDGRVNVTTHHWSDNVLKGQETYEWLDAFVGAHSDRFTYTFIGRTRAYLQNTNRVQPLAGRELGRELGRYDVCINASKFDPGPNSTIEAIACGLPTYVHANGGGSVEFAGRDHVFSTHAELEALLLSQKFEPNIDRFLPWDDVVASYDEKLRSLHG